MILKAILKLRIATISCGGYLRTSERNYSFEKGMELKEIVQRLEKYAPLSLAESWDNIGLLVEPSSTSHAVNSILLTNDLTESVVDEAIQKNTQMILSYHPPIFTPLKKLTRKTWKERVVLKAIENRVAIYSPHTSFDIVKGGVNDWLATGLGNGTIEPIKCTLADHEGGMYKVNIMARKNGSELNELIMKLKEADKNIDVNIDEDDFV